MTHEVDRCWKKEIFNERLQDPEHCETMIKLLATKSKSAREDKASDPTQIRLEIRKEIKQVCHKVKCQILRLHNCSKCSKWNKCSPKCMVEILMVSNQ